MERRLAAILLTDMVGYSRLMGLDEEGTIARQKAHRKELIDPKLTAHGGRIVKTTGDGVLVEFPSVVDAVKCAVEVQQAMAGSEPDVPEERRIHYRIGINLGDIVIDGDDILGDGVNVAARLEGLAKPGGICISGTVHDHLAGKMDIAFEDAGEQTVKNVPRPVRVWHWHTDRIARGSGNLGELLPLPDKPSIAVLPFENMSGDPEQEYFADGIAEDITTSLSKLSQLLVIARNSSFTYKGRSAKVQDIARELGVQYVIEGSVRKIGSRVRVSSQLIDCLSGGHLWAERFDRELTDIFAVQDEVTKKIVSAMAVTLTADERERLTPSGPDNLKAYDYFLQGREASRQSSRNDNERAAALLKRAIELAPEYSSAHAFLSFVYLADYFNQWTEDSAQSLGRAKETAESAVTADENDPYAHLALGKVYMWNRRHEDAVSEHERTIELDPNFAVAYAGLGHTLHFAGQSEEAIKRIEQGMRLDPHYPDHRLQWLALPYFQLERYETSIGLLERLLSRKPDMDISRVLLAASYGHVGRIEEARQQWDEALRINPKYSLESRRKILPYKNPSDFDRITDGLRKAGIAGR